MSVHQIERMSVEIDGAGPDLLMIHGLGGSANIFESLVMELKREFRVIRPELPGSTRSQTPLKLEFADYAVRIESLLKLLSIERVHLAGHSLGTLVCQQLAIRNPQAVRSLMLFGAVTEPPEPARQALQERAAMVRREGVPAVINAVLDGTTSTQSRTARPLAIAFIRQLLQAQDDQGYAMTCEALAQAQAVDGRQINCPTLLVTGEDDMVTPPSMMSLLADQIAACRTHLVPGCGHWTTVEAAQESAQQARSFMNSIAR